MLAFLLFLSFFMNIVFASDTECPLVTTPGADRRSDKNKLRLVQYNVEWLFIDYYSSSNCPGSGCTWKNQSAAETHMNYVSNIIKDINPDIINFCEIEGCDELNILKGELTDDQWDTELPKAIRELFTEIVKVIEILVLLLSLIKLER